MRFHGAVVDLDGTVVRGESLVPGATDGLDALRDATERVLFLTNNPIVPPDEYAARLREQGVDATADEVLTATAATVAYLDEHHAGERAFVIAEASVTRQLRDANVALTDDPEAAEVVVAGFDREFRYDDMTDAIRALRDGVAFVGTDRDRTIPSERGEKPGSGAIINAVGGVAGREPDAVLGKPSETTARLAAERLSVPAEECLLVGDRLDTDVAMGEAVGMTTALVRTGVTDDDALADSDVQPEYVLDSLGEVGRLLD